MQATTTTELTRDEKRQIKRDYKARKRMTAYDLCGMWVFDIMNIRIRYALDAYSDAFSSDGRDWQRDRMCWYFTWKALAKDMTEYFRTYKGKALPLP